MRHGGPATILLGIEQVADSIEGYSVGEYVVRPIQAKDLDLISSMCWDSREAQLHLLGVQKTLGFGAWMASRCVAQLHCYSVSLPEWDETWFPSYGRESPETWPLGWPLRCARDIGIAMDRAVWGHACFHVGFDSPRARTADPGYFAQGIGTALLKASVDWAREHGYGAVLAHGGTNEVYEYNHMMGCMPWTSYQKLGFECIGQEKDGERMPWWTEAGNATPDVLSAVGHAVEAGLGPKDLCARAMLLMLE